MSILLEVQDLRTTYTTPSGLIPAVDGVSLSIPRGKTTALVGESGCGKTALALSIIGLIPQPGRIEAGSILLHDTNGQAPLNLLTLSPAEMRRVRGGRIAFVFQDPMNSLNPVMPIGKQITEAIAIHKTAPPREAGQLAARLLGEVGLPQPHRLLKTYPHQLSGGMQQRVMIAMALAGSPDLLIADEPTTGLDVTIEAQILDLLARLSAIHRLSVLLITHDTRLLPRIADEVCIMYAGRIVERAPTQELLRYPMHPYTKALLGCAPYLGRQAERLNLIPGELPRATELPAGCRFQPRCMAIDKANGQSCSKHCHDEQNQNHNRPPQLREIVTDHWVACWETSAPTDQHNLEANAGATPGTE